MKTSWEIFLSEGSKEEIKAVSPVQQSSCTSSWSQRKSTMLIFLLFLGQAFSMSLTEVIYLWKSICCAKYIFSRGSRPHLYLQQCTQPLIQKCPAMCMSAKRMRRDSSLRWKIIKCWTLCIIIFNGVVMLCGMLFQGNFYRFSVVHFAIPKPM